MSAPGVWSVAKKNKKTRALPKVTRRLELGPQPYTETLVKLPNATHVICPHSSSQALQTFHQDKQTESGI